jgi:hypothetical protein
MRKSFHYERNWPAGGVPTIIGSAGETLMREVSNTAWHPMLRSNRLRQNRARAEWTSTPQDGSDAALLYLHGGGYVIGSLDSHRHLVAEVGRAAGCWALALDYRLAPEHPDTSPKLANARPDPIELKLCNSGWPRFVGWNARLFHVYLNLLGW